MYMKQYLFLSLFLFAGMFSCSDLDDPNLITDTSQSIVIQAKLIKGNPSTIEVEAYNKVDIDGAKRRLNVKDVYLISETGNSIKLEPEKVGTYKQTFGPDTPFDVSFDDRYQLRVELTDGQVMESDFQSVESSIGSDELDFLVEFREYVDNLGDVFELPQIILYLKPTMKDLQENPRRYRWFLQRDFRFTDTPHDYEIREPTNPTEFKKPKTCYVNDNLEKATEFIPIHDGYSSVGSQQNLSFEIFSGIIRSVYSDTMYFSVVKESLSEFGYHVYDQMVNLLEVDSQSFDQTAGNIKSNFVNIDNPKEHVFGYFYVTEQTISRKRITPDMVGNPEASCPGEPNPHFWSPGQCWDLWCCDCLSIENSTIDKPDFWQ